MTTLISLLLLIFISQRVFKSMQFCLMIVTGPGLEVLGTESLHTHPHAPGSLYVVLGAQ